MPSTFSPEIIKQIELGNLDEALRLAHDEVLKVYVAKQRDHIEIAKKWLK